MARSKRKAAAPPARSRITSRAVGALLPLALSMLPVGTTQPARTADIETAGTDTVTVVRPTGETEVRTTRKKAAPKEFSIPLDTLRAWAKAVVVTIPDVEVTGKSGVHALADDCEIHFGARAPSFSGVPAGLVMEPMNACVADPPTSFKSWAAFANEVVKQKVVTASGVPRIWPEHLVGGTDSNPDHAVELHPLTSIVVGGKPFDLTKNVDAGEYAGKENNQKVVKVVNVSVTAADGQAEVAFQGGQIGNFTTLDLLIDRASIADDGEGSFRMDGEVVVDDTTSIPVRIVTAKGSPINDSMPKLQKRRGKTVSIDGALILYSLSPEALLAAADKSGGSPVAVERPIQLILYGTPELD